MSSFALALRPRAVRGAPSSVRRDRAPSAVREMSLDQLPPEAGQAFSALLIFGQEVAVARATRDELANKFYDLENQYTQALMAAGINTAEAPAGEMALTDSDLQFLGL